MTIKQLEELNGEERDLVMTAPALISVLIGSADGHFDDREISQAEKAIKFRGIQGEPVLFEYYQVIEHSFKSVLRHIIQKYDGEPVKRAMEIEEDLAKLNDILPKLDKQYATILVENWRSLAKSIAKASGGFLGYHQISNDESHFVDLEVIRFDG